MTRTCQRIGSFRQLRQKRHAAVHSLFALGLLLLCSAASAQVVDGSVLVEPALYAVEAKGERAYTLVLHFKIQKGWHLYWKNAGDAGFAPRVKWQLPDGSKIGDLQFPTPHKIVESGLVAFGYTDELVLLSELELPATLPTDLTISAELDWLVCKESCVPGSARVALNLKALRPQDREVARRLLQKVSEALPKPLALSGLECSKVTFDGKAITLSFSGKSVAPIRDFFPEPHDQLLFRYSEFKVEQQQVVMPVTTQGQLPANTLIKGVLLIGEKGYEVSVPLLASAEIPASTAASSRLLEQEFVGVKAQTAELPLGLALLFALLGGLILNVMPCVLPVLSLKVMGLIQSAHQSKSESAKHGLVFTLGVLVSFWILALLVVLLQQAGEQVGWGFQFQSPMFVLVMILVMFVFGLNLAGVFEFSTPSVSSELSQTLMRSDLSSTFANGILATTLATPCTAPFLGSALGFAFSQPAAVIFLVFTAVGLGLALPYLILAIKPQWLKFIPKPGAWMYRFKQAMSFPLFATAIWLLSVLGEQLGLEGVIAALILLLAVGVGCWLIGQFIDLQASWWRKATIWTLVVTIVGITYFITFERNLNWRAAKVLSQVETPANSKILWQPFSIAAIESAVQSGKTVFVDFTAEWCFTCKVTEKTVLETDAVERKMAELGIVPIRADWTNRNDEITRLLKKFGRSGVPLYVVFPSGRLNEPIVLPEVLTPELLIEALEKAARKQAVAG
ncbi:MAG: protein-disulfide reductase DsbD family protein [Chloroherpetonaceae bacterium]|nr:protein-disulfide reductase DsbD family protein [Chloroherpetonaceae bacterium]